MGFTCDPSSSTYRLWQRPVTENYTCLGPFEAINTKCGLPTFAAIAFLWGSILEAAIDIKPEAGTQWQPNFGQPVRASSGPHGTQCRSDDCGAGVNGTAASLWLRRSIGSSGEIHTVFDHRQVGHQITPGGCDSHKDRSGRMSCRCRTVKAVVFESRMVPRSM